MKKLVALILAVLILGSQAFASDWVERSNENAQLVLDMLAQFGPEGAAALGVDGLDEEIFDLRPKVYERSQKAAQDVKRQLARRLDKEADPSLQERLSSAVRGATDVLAA